jgi:signal transduction histidine kinase
MTQPPGRGGRRGELSLRRLTMAALLVAAVLPVLGSGLLVSVRLGTALHDDARLRAEQASLAARALVARSEADLERLLGSYAGWPRLAEAVAAGDLDTIQHDVLEFLVEQGSASGAVLLAGERSISAGRADLVAALAEAVARKAEGTATRTLADGVYLVAIAPVGAAATNGASSGPTDAFGRLGALAFARRLDVEFAVELRGLTGFEVAIVGGSRVAVATDPETVARLGPIAALPAIGERSGLLFARVPIGSDSVSGASSETAELLLATSLPAAQAATGQLPALVVALAVATAAAAVLLALWLSRLLARRLAAVHEGLLAVADGRRPAPLPTADDDPVDRLVVALGRLLAALDRRETTVRRSLEAVASEPIDRPPVEVAAALLDACDDIFGLRWSAILEPDGAVFARSRHAPAELDRPGVAADRPPEGERGPTATAESTERPALLVAELDPRSSPPTDGPSAARPARRLVASLPEPGSGDPQSGPQWVWTPADEATLRLVAVLVGTAIEDAERYASAAERADRLDRLNRLQRQFLRSISHNLKTPLATIGLALDDLEDVVGGDPYLARRAQAIRAEAARLGRLVEQVLTLSRLEAGTVDLSAEALVPADLVATVWRELDVERPFRIDDRSGRRPVLADRRSLEQIVWNLLDNAVRYAPTGTIEVRVDLRPAPDAAGAPASADTVGAPASAGTAEAPGTAGTLVAVGPRAAAELEIAVLDEGPGVPSGERGRIFHRFTRGSTAGRQAGTGLGLSLARSLARLMGGDLVYVDRGPGSGACFLLRIPVGVADARASAAPDGDAGAPGRRHRRTSRPGQDTATASRGRRGPNPQPEPEHRASI